jgi:hypothetical protein
MRRVLVQPSKKELESRDQSPEALDKVGEHPKRVREHEATLNPGRASELVQRIGRGRSHRFHLRL